MATSVSSPGWIRAQSESTVRKVEWPLLGAAGLLLIVGSSLSLAEGGISLGRLPVAELLIGLGIIAAGAALYSGLRRPIGGARVDDPSSENSAIDSDPAPAAPAMSPEPVASEPSPGPPVRAPEPQFVPVEAPIPALSGAGMSRGSSDPLRQLEQVLRERSPQLLGTRSAAPTDAAREVPSVSGEYESVPAAEWPRFGPTPTLAPARGPGLCVRCHTQLPAGAAWRRCGICGSPLCADCLVESLRTHGRAVCDDCAKLIGPSALTPTP